MFVVDDGEVVVAVAEVAEGCGADEVDRVVDLHVNQGLGEVVEGLRCLGHYDHDLAIAVAEGLADGFAFRFVLDEFSVVDERAGFWRR